MGCKKTHTNASARRIFACTDLPLALCFVALVSISDHSLGAVVGVHETILGAFVTPVAFDFSPWVGPGGTAGEHFVTRSVHPQTESSSDGHLRVCRRTMSEDCYRGMESSRQKTTDILVALFGGRIDLHVYSLQRSVRRRSSKCCLSVANDLSSADYICVPVGNTRTCQHVDIYISMKTMALPASEPAPFSTL